MSAVPDGAPEPAPDEIVGYYAVTQRVFGWLAPYYDVVALLVAPLRRTVVTFADAPAGCKVLDVATGTGAQALAFARRGYDVTAIDLVSEMLAVAKRKRGSGAVRFEQMDATQLSLPDAAFDVTTISFGLHDMPATIRERVLAEMVRVTRPGGSVVVVDYGLPSNRHWRACAVRVIRSWERGYYDEFVHVDPAALLTRAGIVVDAQRTAWFGAVRLLRGHVASASPGLRES